MPPVDMDGCIGGGSVMVVIWTIALVTDIMSPNVWRNLAQVETTAHVLHFVTQQTNKKKKNLISVHLFAFNF